MAEQAVQHTFPPDYVALLQCTNGFGPYTEHYDIALFRTHDLAEMNVAYEVHQYVPTLLFIGLDGGGRGIFLDRTSEAGAVYRCGMGALDLSETVFLAPSLAAWIDSHFDLKDPPSPPSVVHPDAIDVYLVRAPRDGLKGLFRLRQALDLALPPSLMRTVLGHLPYRILHAVPYLPYSWQCTEQQRQDDCLYLCEVDQPDQPMPFPTQ